MKPTIRTGLIARLIALALALALIAGACGDSGSDDEEAQVNAGGEESDESSDDTEADDEEAADAGAIDSWELPQSMIFSSLEWTLESAEVRDRLDPDGEAPEEPETWVAIDWSATNPIEDTEVEIPAASFQLLFEDGSYVIGGSPDENVVVQAGASNNGQVAFLIPEDADLATATFQFLGDEREPGSIRLDGTGEAEPERVDAAVDPAEATVTGDACALELVLMDSYFSREALVEDGLALVGIGSATRAPEDHVWVHLVFDARSTGAGRCQVRNHDLTVDGTTSKVNSPDVWHWVPEGNGWETEAGLYWPVLPEGASGPVVASFPIPDDAESAVFTMRVNNDENPETQFTIDTSGLEEFPSID